MDGRRTSNPNNKSSSSTAQGRSRITVSAEQSSGFREIYVKCPIEYRTTKSTTQKNYDKLLNFWVDVMTTHDLMGTETTQMSKKNLDNSTVDNCKN